MITFRKDIGEPGSEKGSEKSSERIIALIFQNPEVSAKELAAILKISPRAVEKQISNLKKAGLIKRVGSPKGGHWEVLPDQ